MRSGLIRIRIRPTRTVQLRRDAGIGIGIATESDEHPLRRKRNRKWSFDVNCRVRRTIVVSARIVALSRWLPPTARDMLARISRRERCSRALR